MQYQSRISGPLLDRIDMHIKMDDVNYKYSEIANDIEEESSEDIKERVIQAREIQQDRYKNEEFYLNSQVPDGKTLLRYCMPKDDDAIKTIDVITEKLGMSMRGVGKIIRVARTIADLDGSEEVKKEHILKASLFRQQILNNF